MAFRKEEKGRREEEKTKQLLSQESRNYPRLPGAFSLEVPLWDPQCKLRGSLKNQIAVDGSAIFEPARC